MGLGGVASGQTPMARDARKRHNANKPVVCCERRRRPEAAAARAGVGFQGRPEGQVRAWIREGGRKGVDFQKFLEEIAGELKIAKGRY